MASRSERPSEWEERIFEDLLENRIRPRVRDFRQKWFKGPAATSPFPVDWGAAVEWIEAVQDEHPVKSAPHELWEALPAARKRLEEATGRRFESDLDEKLLWYSNRDGWRTVARLVHNSPLMELYDLAADAEAKWGCAKQKVYEHILCGGTLAYPRVQVKGSWVVARTKNVLPRPPEYTITVRGLNITRDDLLNAFDQIRDLEKQDWLEAESKTREGTHEHAREQREVQRVLQKQRSAPLQKRDYELIRALRELGGFPEREKVKTFGRLAEKLGVKIEAIRSRYYRLPGFIRDDLEMRHERGLL